MAGGLKRTVSDAAIYGIGNGLQRAVGFIMLPIYTQYLSPADYGTISMVQILLDLTSLLFGAQLATGVFRHYYKEKDEVARKEVLSTAMGFVVISKGAGALALSLFATPASYLLFAAPGYETYVAFFAFAVLTDSLSMVPTQFIRIQQRPYLYVGVSLTKLLIQLLLNIWLIVFLNMGVMGVILSSIVSGLLVGGSLSIWFIRHTGLRFRWQRVKSLFGYSWPLIGTGLLGIGMASMSRIGLTHFHGLHEVGLFALATQLSAVLHAVIWRPFNQAWGPTRFELAQSKNAKPAFQRAFRLIGSILIVAATAIAVLAEPMLKVMSAPTFHKAADAVPLLLLATLIRTMTFFSQTPLLLHDRTVEVLRSTIMQTIVLALALFALVPSFSIVGAACGAVISAIIGNWWITRQTRKAMDLELPWRDFAIALLLAGAALITSLFTPHDLVLGLLLKLAILAAYFFAALFLPLLGSELRNTIVGYVLAGMRRLLRIQARAP